MRFIEKHITAHCLVRDTTILVLLLARAVWADAQTITLDQGVYTSSEFESRMDSLESGLADRIVGRGNVVVRATEAAGFISNPPHLTTTLASAGVRGAFTIEVASAAGVVPGDWVRLRSDSLAEVGWSYGLADVAYVESVAGSTVTLADSIHFDYESAGTTDVYFYRPRRVAIEGIRFDMRNWTDPTFSAAVRFEGFEVSLERIAATGVRADQLDVAQVVYSPWVRVRNLDVEGFKYGVLVATCRDVVAREIVAHDVRHAIAPTSWAADVRVSRLYGTDTDLDAHPSFDVVHDSCHIAAGGSISLRGFGMTLKNSTIVARRKTDRTYVGPISLTDRGRAIADDYEIVFDGVTYVGEVVGDPGYDLLTFYRSGLLSIANSTLSSVATVDFFRTEITDSRLGRFHGYAMDFDIRRTSFEAAMQRRGAKPYPALRGSFGGAALIEDCTFSGYAATSLVGFASSTTTDYTFRDCTFGRFAQVLGGTGQPIANYDPIKFVSCTFTSPLPTQPGLQIAVTP